MPYFEVRVQATAEITELWKVEADTPDQARQRFDDAETDHYTFVETVETDGEHDRVILDVRPFEEVAESAPSLAERLATLRAAGFYVAPDGSPGHPRWKAGRLLFTGQVMCMGYAEDEETAVAKAEAECRKLAK